MVKRCAESNARRVPPMILSSCETCAFLAAWCAARRRATFCAGVSPASGAAAAAVALAAALPATPGAAARRAGDDFCDAGARLLAGLWKREVEVVVLLLLEEEEEEEEEEENATSCDGAARRAVVVVVVVVVVALKREAPRRTLRTGSGLTIVACACVCVLCAQMSCSGISSSMNWNVLGSSVKSQVAGRRLSIVNCGEKKLTIRRSAGVRRCFFRQVQLFFRLAGKTPREARFLGVMIGRMRD